MSHNEKPATIEMLSAYLDGELSQAEVRSLEQLLEGSAESRARLEGLRRVVTDLGQWSTVEPPPTLEHHVVRRIAIERDRASWSDRLEDRLRMMSPHNPILLMFALVVSLAISMFLLSLGAQRASEDDVSVVVVDDTIDGQGEGVAKHVVGTRLEVAGRVFFWDGARWQQRGVSTEGMRALDLDSEQGQAWLQAHPSFFPLHELGEPAVVEVDGEVLLLNAVPPPAGAERDAH